MKDASPNEISIEEMMGRMSDHLDSLACKVFEIEDALGRTLDGQKPNIEDGSAITRLQSLDFLRQSLEDLALMTCLVSKNSKYLHDHKLPVERICAGLKLDTTRFVVIGKDTADKEKTSQNTGEFDLF